MKKGNYVLAVLGCAFLLGCGQKEGEKVSGTNPEAEKKTEFVSEDYNESTGRLLKTDKGYYYYSYEKKGFRYVDGTTGNDMYLCNKPECKHDGNRFCVATNEKYVVLGTYLYNGALIANVVEATETEFLYKLLRIETDGSAASEICTYYSVVKDGLLHYGGTGMCVHRNKVFLTIELPGNQGLPDTERNGVAIVDLNTEKVTYLDEEALSADNPATTNVTAFGDYFYYVRKEGKKCILYRYSVTDGSVTPHSLFVGFKGDYAVAEEGQLTYLKSAGRVLCIYSYENEYNEEVLKFVAPKQYVMPDGTFFESEKAYTAVDVEQDDLYYYVAESGYSLSNGDPDRGGELLETYNRIFVYNKDLENVAILNMANLMEELHPESEEKLYTNYTSIQYIGGNVYWTISDGQGMEYLYCCKREDFVSGNPQFKLEYEAEKY